MEETDEQHIYSVAAMAAAPARLAEIASWSAEHVLGDCLRWGNNPDAYSDEAVERRAERDVTSDLEGDARLGWRYTPEEAETYRSVYIAAFARAWRDPALAQQIRARRTGSVVICTR